MCWGLCRHICGLGAAKGTQELILLLPAGHRLGGKHQGQGQVCAGHLETWETKSPRCCSELGNQSYEQLVSRREGQAALALSQYCSLQLELLHPDLSQPQKALLYPFPKVTEVLSEQQGLETGVLLCREKHNASDFWKRLSKAQVVPGKVKCRIFLIHCSVSAGSDTKRFLTWRWACEFWHRGPDYEMSWMNFA